MYLITVKHAGVVLEVVATEDPETWHAAEGKNWRLQYSSCQIATMYLGSTQPEPTPEPTPKKGAK